MNEHKKAISWFDDLYKENANSQENIPWARKDVNPMLQTYLQEHKENKGKALVIGCGLGDDAYALSQVGYDVLAIDISTTALKLAEDRFPNSGITFEEQDVFNMPDKYYEHFDFVFEAFTIQSLPREFREKMIKAVSNTVKVEGKLLLVTHKFESEKEGPPWPLIKEEVDLFKEHKLKELSFEVIDEESPITRKKFRVLYIKNKYH